MAEDRITEALDNHAEAIALLRDVCEGLRTRVEALEREVQPQEPDQDIGLP